MKLLHIEGRDSEEELAVVVVVVDADLGSSGDNEVEAVAEAC